MKAQGLNTRERLLDGALQCLLERGHAGASVKAVAETAGVNHGLVHHYFGSKERMYAELIRREADRLYAAMRKARTPHELREILLSKVFPDTEFVRLLIECFAMSPRMPLIAAELREILRSRRELFGGVIGADEPALLTRFVATLLGLSLVNNLEASAPVREAMEQLFEQFSS